MFGKIVPKQCPKWYFWGVFSHGMAGLPPPWHPLTLAVHSANQDPYRPLPAPPPPAFLFAGWPPPCVAGVTCVVTYVLWPLPAAGQVNNCTRFHWQFELMGDGKGVFSGELTGRRNASGRSKPWSVQRGKRIGRGAVATNIEKYEGTHTQADTKSTITNQQPVGVGDIQSLNHRLISPGDCFFQSD